MWPLLAPDRRVCVRAAAVAVVLFSAAGARAERAWHVGLGGAWAVPLDSGPNDWQSGRARQDVAATLLLLVEPAPPVLLQLEAFLGGFSASQPAFVGGALRVGASMKLPVAGATGYAAVGAAYLRMTGRSQVDCGPVDCQQLDGSGIAFSGEAALVVPLGERVAATPFVEALLPQFDVRAASLPGNAATVPLLLVGVRILL